MHGRENKPQVDALSVALDAVSDRWSLHVVRALALGAVRYTEIQRELGAPRDVLAARLRVLVAQGIVRRVDPEDVRSGYALTPKGEDLGQVVLVLKRWGDAHSDPSVARRRFVHVPCGEVFTAEVCCSACGRPAVRGDLVDTTVAPAGKLQGST